MDLRDFLGVIWRWKILVIIVTLLVGGGVAYLEMNTPATYSAEATLLVGLDEISLISPNAVAVVQSGERLSATYAEMIQSSDVLQKAAETSGVYSNGNVFRGKLSTTTVKNTPVLKVMITDTDPQKAKDAVNAVAEAFLVYVDDIGTKSIDNSRKSLDEELASVETELIQLRAQPDVNAGRIAALEVRRDALITQYGEVVGRGKSGDVTITAFAESAVRTSRSTFTNILLASVIGLVGGIAMAFLAEGVKNAITYE